MLFQNFFVPFSWELVVASSTNFLLKLYILFPPQCLILCYYLNISLCPSHLSWSKATQLLSRAVFPLCGAEANPASVWIGALLQGHVQLAQKNQTSACPHIFQIPHQGLRPGAPQAVWCEHSLLSFRRTFCLGSWKIRVSLPLLWADLLCLFFSPLIRAKLFMVRTSLVSIQLSSLNSRSTENCEASISALL